MKLRTALVLALLVLIPNFVTAEPENRPAKCFIKGIIRFGEKIYYSPGDRKYYDLALDVGRGDRWFCSAKEAEEAGWRGSIETRQNPDMVRSDGSPVFTPDNYPFTNGYIGVAVGYANAFDATNIKETGSVRNISVTTTLTDLKVSNSMAWLIKTGAFLKAVPWLGIEASYYERYPSIPLQSTTVTATLANSGQVFTASGNGNVALDVDYLRTVGLSAIAKFPVEGISKPYVGAGVALNFVGLKDIGSDVAVGPLVHAGIETQINKNVKIFTEARYTKSDFSIAERAPGFDLNFSFSDLALVFGLQLDF